MTQAATAIVSQAVSPVIESLEATINQLGRSWYVINQGDGGEAEIRIYEDIGLFGVSAKQFADDIEQISAKRIHIRINSYGGEAFDGIAIHNALKAHPAKVVIHVDGIAASAASIIAMSGDEIHMASNAFLMIHEARGGVMGEAGDMRQYADMLDKLNDAIAGTYQARAGKNRKYWRGKMAEESWFSAEEAKSEQLIDAIEEPEKSAKNRFDFKIYNKAPDAARKAWARMEVQTNSAPEAPQRSEVDPVSITQESTNMADNPTQVAPAQNTAGGTESITQNNDPLRAQEIRGYVEQGRAAGILEGQQKEIERCKRIVDVCPTKPKMALDAFLKGQSPEAVQMAFEAASAAEAAAESRIAQMQEENRRAVALAATGGYPGGIHLGAVEAEEMSDGPMSPEAAKEAAGKEWDRSSKVRAGFTTKDRYVAVRKAELLGQFNRAK